ncbi:hypothetical protein BK750_03900 [Bacillus thuringiensis serovar jegathesan]|uniref:Uncharacterized protein n=1 Tax=Bacillus thuringiensis subsp. jegathesan TaxID=56955 RepID=A0A9X6MET7_BACTJ|nr:hypothetical protein BK750_03900 [Bacillus thuringiensis serovar jegathesan]
MISAAPLSTKSQRDIELPKRLVFLSEKVDLAGILKIAVPENWSHASPVSGIAPKVVWKPGTGVPFKIAVTCCS